MPRGARGGPRRAFKWRGMNVDFDTIVVPMPIGEFKRVLVGKSRWYPVAIAEKNIHRLKWLAAYVTRPTSAITHKARVGAIKRRADGRYVVHVDGAVTRINPVPMGRAKGGIRRPWYTDQSKLLSAKSIRDL